MLTYRSHNPFQLMANTFKATKWNVYVLDNDQGIAEVCRRDEVSQTSRKFSVNLSLGIQDRCCATYWQTGQFCEHAWAVMVALKRTKDDDLFTEKYFDADCLTSSLRPMRDVKSLHGALPSTRDVDQAKLRNPHPRTIRAVTYIDNKTVKDTQRIPSAGEQKKKRKPQDLVECPACRKRLCYGTLHSKGGHIVRGEACTKYLQKTSL